MNKFHCAVMIAAFLTLSIWGTGPARSASFSIIETPGSEHPMIFMDGAITEGDARRFIDMVGPLSSATISSATIALSGPGGSILEAFRIGSEIRLRGLSTTVLPGEECASACGLIWLSGVRRYMSAHSNIGFHAAYIIQNGEPRETGMGNAEIGSYMTHMGYGIEAIRFMTAAPPNGMNQLTLQTARALGIDVYENRGSNVISPQDAPSKWRLSRQVSYSSAVIQNCGLFFTPQEKAALASLVEAILARGSAEYGNESFLKAVLQDRDQLEYDIGAGGMEWCTGTAVSVLVDQLHENPALQGASFNCRRAGTPTEIAVCSDVRLARLDSLMADIYAMALAWAEPIPAHVRSGQIDWLKSRNDCGADTVCLTASYEGRTRELLRTPQ